jgi:hypothetical protein
MVKSGTIQLEVRDGQSRTSMGIPATYQFPSRVPAYPFSCVRGFTCDIDGYPHISNAEANVYPRQEVRISRDRIVRAHDQTCSLAFFAPRRSEMLHSRLRG